MADTQTKQETPPAVLHEQQAMKEKTKQVEEQTQSRVNQQEPHGNLAQHPNRKLG